MPKKRTLTAAENRERIALEDSREAKKKAKKKARREKDALDRKWQIAEFKRFRKGIEHYREELEQSRIVAESIEQLDNDFPWEKPVFDKGQTASHRGGAYISKKRREDKW